MLERNRVVSLKNCSAFYWTAHHSLASQVAGASIRTLEHHTYSTHTPISPQSACGFTRLRCVYHPLTGPTPASLSLTTVGTPFWPMHPGLACSHPSLPLLATHASPRLCSPDSMSLMMPLAVASMQSASWLSFLPHILGRKSSSSNWATPKGARPVRATRPMN